MRLGSPNQGYKNSAIRITGDTQVNVLDNPCIELAERVKDNRGIIFNAI